MENSSSDLFNEAKQKNSQEHHSSKESPEYSSEIEKLYLRIKEDWL